MIRVFYLFWTLIASFLVTGFSYFYVSSQGAHGFPFSFATEVEDGIVGGEIVLKFKVWMLVFDLLFWWILFSILLVIVKNYVFESD
ncbi:MAG: hypothetical protein WD231_05920 [Candidatus Woykebacteria bacterium]